MYAQSRDDVGKSKKVHSFKKNLFILEFHSKFVYISFFNTDTLISDNLSKSSNTLSVH